MKHGSTEKPKSWLMRCKTYWLGEWFDPHTSFLKLPAFWAPFIIIVFFFAFLCWRVTVDNQLVIGVGGTVQEMYDWFKIPLWVLALLIPVIGLFNANHKSEQAKAAMELTRSQNNFANYYKHMEEFSKYVDSVIGSKTVPTTFAYYRPLHSLIFPSSYVSDYSVNKVTEQYLEEFLDSYIAIAKELSGSNTEQVLELLSRLEIHRNTLCYRFDFSFGCYPQEDKDRSSHFISNKFSEGNIHVINGAIKDYLDYISRFPNLLHRICMFDRGYFERSGAIARKIKLTGAIVCFTVKGRVEFGKVIDSPVIDWDRIDASFAPQST